MPRPSARRATSSRACAAEAAGAGASSSSTRRSRTGCPTSASSPPTTSRGSARSARPPAPPGVADDARATDARLAYDGFTAAVPERAAGDVQARLEQRALELWQSFELLERCSTGRSARVAARAGGAQRDDRHRPRREPPRRDELHRRAQRRPPRAAPAPHRLVRELAVGRTRRRRTTCSPTSRSSTRASSSATPAPTADADAPPRPPPTPPRRRAPRPDRGRSLALRHVDAGSCNGCEHELTLTSSPYYDLQRFGLGIVASPRHADVLLVTGPVTTRMREPLLTAYAAMPEPRRVAALGDCALGCSLLGTTRRSSAPSTTSSPSTSASPAARPPPRRSRPRSSTSSTPKRSEPKAESLRSRARGRTLTTGFGLVNASAAVELVRRL